MKWDKPSGSVQLSADGRYCVMRANSEDWIAYELSSFGTTAQKLDERKSDVEARAVCEDHEAQLVTTHRKSA